MNIENLVSLNIEISACDERNKESCRCKGCIDAKPLHDKPLKTQTFMLITRDPSNNANKEQVLVGSKNRFFVNHILPLFYSNYNQTKAKQSDHYFHVFQKHFHENIYWTHYAKCFPGVNPKGKHGHKIPNSYCANQFLKREIHDFDPQYLILVGDHIIRFLTKKKTKDHINDVKIYDLPFNLNGRIYKYLISTHPSDANAYKVRYKFSKTREIIQQTYESSVGLPNN